MGQYWPRGGGTKPDLILAFIATISDFFCLTEIIVKGSKGNGLQTPLGANISLLFREDTPHFRPWLQ